MPEEKNIIDKWRKKINTYDKDGGFIVYEEGYDNNDFDTDLMEDFLRNELQALKEEVVSEENGEGANWGHTFNQGKLTGWDSHRRHTIEVFKKFGIK